MKKLLQVLISAMTFSGLALMTLSQASAQPGRFDTMTMAEKVVAGESYHGRQAVPLEPFRVVGNIYFVGSTNIGIYLIATPEGHILVDSGVNEMSTTIRDSVEKLGFRMSDIKIMLSSHAHFDHLAPHREILCSTGTARLMRARMPGERIEHVLPYEQTEQLTTDTTVTLYPAGHIYGSAQSLLTHPEHGRLLYTGDFKTRRSRTAEAVNFLTADTLILETTFGLPHYAFPPPLEVESAVLRFVHDTLAVNLDGQ